MFHIFVMIYAAHINLLIFFVCCLMRMKQLAKLGSHCSATADDPAELITLVSISEDRDLCILGVKQLEANIAAEKSNPAIRRQWEEFQSITVEAKWLAALYFE